MLKDFRQSLIISAWFVFLTFPLIAVRVDTAEQLVEWRFINMLYVAIGAFGLSYLWRYSLERKQKRMQVDAQGGVKESKAQLLMEDMSFRYKAMGILLVFALTFPLLFDTYQVNIMNLALIYVVLGLGLNISVGLAGLLDLGYIAFFGVGAYSYGLLNYHFDLGFWAILPVGGILSCMFGVVLGFPILRLRGDYLAIVTLGFGMIFQIVLQNWSDFTMGMVGISNIDSPGLFGMDMNITGSITYIYYIMLALVVFTILITMRLRNSRIGRAWIALREDEIACVAMGIDMARTKLSAYALGAFWAGMIGVLFAAKQAYINPASFGFMESAIVLSIVVLGGMGSILGVILGAFILILLPEYLRAFSEYRMLAFGAAMVLMMIFRPQGIISNIRQKYEYKGLQEETDNG